MRLPALTPILALITAVLMPPLTAQAVAAEVDAPMRTPEPANGSTYQASFNKFGQLTWLVLQERGGKAQTRQFTFDADGRLTSQTEPETQTTTFGDFDATGQPCTISDSSHRTLRRTFDGLGRLQGVNSGTQSLAACYQGRFLMGRNGSNGVDQAFTYGGPEGRAETESLTIDGVQRRLSYTYDSNGRLAQVIYPSGRVVGYGYDVLGRVSQVTNNGSPLLVVGYGGQGGRTSLSFASGTKSAWTLDESGSHWQTWTVAFAGGSETRKYQYDALNHLTESGEWTLQHDAGGRLTSAQGFGLNASYEYDAFGNNIVHTLSGSCPSTFNAFRFESLVDNRIPEIQADGAMTGWVVRANGEAAQVGIGGGSNRWLNLNWDDFGRLIEVTDSLTGAVQRYRYAPSGLRVSVTDSSDAHRDRQFFYTDDGLLLAEYQGNGEWKRDVIYLEAHAIAEVDGLGVHELHCDQLGTPRVITNGNSGAVEGRQAFGPYGELLSAASMTTGYRPLTGYTGHQMTDATGLIYMRGRFYSPDWHRFLSPDHGVDPHSWNQFSYVGGSPFQHADPTGFMDGGSDHGGFKWDGGDHYSATVEVHGDSPSGGSESHDWTSGFSRGGNRSPGPGAADSRAFGSGQTQQTHSGTTGWTGSQGGPREPANAPLRPFRPSARGSCNSGRPMPGGDPAGRSAQIAWRAQTDSSLLRKAWNGLLNIEQAVGEWIERNENQGFGLGRITDSEVPGKLAELAKADPLKANQIQMMKRVLNTVPFPMGGGLKMVGSAAVPSTADFFAGTRYSDKVLEQMKLGEFHAFPEHVTAFQDAGQVTKLTGGDGVVREMLKIPGEYRGRAGVFEFIKEPDGQISHRMFKPN